MALNLPHKVEVALSNPPLDQVVCQVRFVPILSLAERLPVDFQGGLRREFPQFSVRKSVQMEMRPHTQVTSQPPLSEYVMETTDGNSAASLGVDYVSFQTKAYSSWKDFIASLTKVMSAFEASYGSPVTTRFGLRFINDLTPENVNGRAMEDVFRVLNRDLTCLLVRQPWSPPEGALIHLLLRGEEERLTLRLVYETEPRSHLVLDLDCYKEITPPEEWTVDNVVSMADRLHVIVYDAFRWSVTDKGLTKFTAEE